MSRPLFIFWNTFFQADSPVRDFSVPLLPAEQFQCYEYHLCAAEAPNGYINIVVQASPFLMPFYPFTPALVIPSTKYFCAEKKRTVPGTSDKTDIANTWFQLEADVVSRDMRSARTMGYFFTLLI